MTTADRRAALRALLRTAGLDGLLVTDLVNVRYLTGFSGSNGAVLVAASGEQDTRFGTDSRYTARAATEVPDLAPVIERATVAALAGRARDLGIRTLGFESDAVTVEAHAALSAVLGTPLGTPPPPPGPAPDAPPPAPAPDTPPRGPANGAPPVELRRAPGLVAQLRVVKDATEIALLRRACEIADAALHAIIADGGLRPGRSEREIALDLEFRMRGLGADGASFDSIVAAGPHSAIPHHAPTDRAVRSGELLKLDFGALVGGYHSDMTRTVVVGRAADWQRELYALVARAQQEGCAAVEAGVPTRDVDAASREVITAAGHGEHFVHGLGHGVGLVIHEAPALSASSGDVLEADMVVTVEPGVYLPDRGGVRIEDTLVVDGETLTGFPKELLEV